MSVRSIRESTLLFNTFSGPLSGQTKADRNNRCALRPARIITINWCLNPADNCWHDKDTMADHKKQR